MKIFTKNKINEQGPETVKGPETVEETGKRKYDCNQCHYYEFDNTHLYCVCKNLQHPNHRYSVHEWYVCEGFEHKHICMNCRHHIPKKNIIICDEEVTLYECGASGYGDELHNGDYNISPCQMYEPSADAIKDMHIKHGN